MPIRIDLTVETELREHARAALPREACGLLAHRAMPGHVHFVRYVPMANVAPSRCRYAMDPIAVAQAENDLRTAGLRLGAVFHSHPDHPATPSDADHRAAWPGLFQLILSVSGDGHTGELTGWVHAGDCLEPHPLLSS